MDSNIAEAYSAFKCATFGLPQYRTSTNLLLAEKALESVIPKKKHILIADYANALLELTENLTEEAFAAGVRFGVKLADGGASGSGKTELAHDVLQTVEGDVNGDD